MISNATPARESCRLGRTIESNLCYCDGTINSREADAIMETVKLDDVIEFDAKRRVRKRLIMADHIESELVCYEPGQGTVEHHHVGQDEIFYVVEGNGTITVDGEARPVSAGSLIFAPAESKHSVETGDNRMVMMFFKGPGRGGLRKRKA